MSASGLRFGVKQIINRKSVDWKVQQRGGEASATAHPGYNITIKYTKLVVIQSYGSRAEADLAKGALEDAGIQAMIQADTAGGMREDLAWSGVGFQILVREEEATEAGEVLTPPSAGDEIPDADFQTDHDPRPPWRRFTLESPHS
jgi:hypothetical protein